MSIQYPPRISLVAGSTQEFTAGDTYVLQEYVNGDWNGYSSAHTIIQSDTSGSYSTLDLSAVGNLTMSYTDFQDIYVINGTITTAGGLDNGGTSGIIFTSASQSSTISTTLSTGEIVVIVDMNFDGSTAYLTYIDASNNLKVTRLCTDLSNVLGTESTIN
jgi:hypothetical protein